MTKLILNFKSNESKKIKSPKNFLGGKGSNLSEMGRMGLPVPPGFTISTKVCEIFYKNKRKLNPKLINQIKQELKIIEKDVDKKFGDLKNPLLLSVRSGARVSMPGMMDTILNLGLNDKTVKALAVKTSNGRFAKDSYRRFIQMYGNVVMGVESYHFEESLSILAGAKREIFEFFDNVKVNEENESMRKNRLELINMLCKTFQNFINFQLLKTNND